MKIVCVCVRYAMSHVTFLLSASSIILTHSKLREEALSARDVYEISILGLSRCCQDNE